MKYTNSSLVTHKRLSPFYNDRGGKAIKKITIHHTAGCGDVKDVGHTFQVREASTNYAVDGNGNVGMYVEEKNRSWASSSADNDYQAVTIEVVNDEYGGNWHVSDKALQKTIELCVDICKRNGIKKLNYTGNSRGNLTRHNMFANTTCPGPYLQSKLPYIANEVNKKLKSEDKAMGYSVKALLRAAMQLKIIPKVTLANDAVIGLGTKKCLKNAQKVLGLEQTGEPDEKTVKLLGELVNKKLKTMAGVVDLQKSIAGV